MNKKNRLEELRLDNLRIIQEELSNYEDINVFKETIDNIITNRELSNTVNERFDTEMFKKLNIFSPYEVEVLELNGIHNIKDLIETDLNDCIGMTKELKEKFEWSRKMYRYDSNNTKNR